MLRGLIQISSFPQSWFHPIAIAGTYPHRGKYIFRVRDPGCASFFFWGGGERVGVTEYTWTSWIQSKHTQIAKFTKSISSVLSRWISNGNPFVGRQVFMVQSQLFPTWILPFRQLWQIKPRKPPQKSWFNPGSFKWTGLVFFKLSDHFTQKPPLLLKFLGPKCRCFVIRIPFLRQQGFQDLDITTHSCVAHGRPTWWITLLKVLEMILAEKLRDHFALQLSQAEMMYLGFVDSSKGRFSLKVLPHWMVYSTSM